MYKTDNDAQRAQPLAIMLFYSLVLTRFLQMLASHFSWIHETLERLGKDGKEAVWRTVGEGVAPEAIDLSESLGYRYV